MGQAVARLFNKLGWGHRDLKILMLGLDAAGKTTILYKLKLNETVTTVATIGFNVETVAYRNVSLTVWDVGGQGRIRELWRYYFNNTEGLIFVVDSNDKDRVVEARDELHRLMAEPELATAKVLVLANKCDMANAMSVAELTQRLNLPSVKSHSWFIQGCCAVTGEGLYQGIDWLCTAVRSNEG